MRQCVVVILLVALAILRLEPSIFIGSTHLVRDDIFDVLVVS